MSDVKEKTVFGMTDVEIAAMRKDIEAFVDPSDPPIYPNDPNGFRRAFQEGSEMLRQNPAAVAVFHISRQGTETGKVMGKAIPGYRGTGGK